MRYLLAYVCCRTGLVEGLTLGRLKRDPGSAEELALEIKSEAAPLTHHGVINH
jgi:hypothetical protein